MTDIRQWLDSLDLGRYADAFEENAIDWEHLPELSHELLIGLGVEAMGHRISILKAIAELEPKPEPEPRGAEVPSSDGSTTASLAGEAERRQLTVMFCDLVGSTALSERMDPEEYRDVLAVYQSAAAAVIRRYDGYIARYMGDGLLVYFGYPQAHEEDQERAVRAGLEIADAVPGLEIPDDDGLHVRVGIATGLVVVGDIVGEGASEERAVLGETPNLAARLQGVAAPDTVVVADATRRLVEGRFELEALGPMQLQGIRAPVLAYRALSATVTSRFEAASARGLSPLVGREEELMLLLRRWSLTREGEGQIVLLAGEAGVGKSRLVRAFQDALGQDLTNRVLYYCSPYHRNSPLYPIIDQLERGFRLESDDDVDLKLEKIESVVRDLDLPPGDIVPHVASMMSLSPAGRYTLPDLDAKALKQLGLDAIVRLVEAMAARAPVLVVVEDLHWADATTLELLQALIERARGSGVMGLFTYRPEFDPPWGSYPHLMSLTLNNLAQAKGRALAVAVAGGKSLPEGVLREIVEKADGVPLFIEEVTKAVLESSLPEEIGDEHVIADARPSLGVPNSLHDSLMARLDRLAAAKEVAQLAATIGRTFSFELLRTVSSASEEALRGALSQLEASGLVYRRHGAGSERYEFKHALVRDTAYASLLRRTREGYHLRIARALERSSAESQPELLAHHYMEGGDNARALDQWQLAGERSIEHSAHVEAAADLSQALVLLKGLPQTPQLAQRELKLRTDLCSALVISKGQGAHEVREAYDRVRELGQRIGDARDQFAVLRGLWMYYLQQEDGRAAHELAEELLVLAEGQQDASLLVEANRTLGAVCFWLGDFTHASEHLKRALELYEPEAHRPLAAVYGQEPGVSCLCYLAWAQWYLGYPDSALRSSQRAVALAREGVHRVTLALALSTAAWTHLYRREGGSACELAEEAIELSSANRFPHFLAMATEKRGVALVQMKQVKEGLDQIRAGTEGYRATGALLATRGCNRAYEAEAQGQAGRIDEGLESLDKALDSVRATGVRHFEAEICRLQGELLLLSGGERSIRAEERLREALEVARRQGARSLELRAAMSLARLWRREERREEARELLEPIYGWFEEGLDTPDLEEAKELLHELR